MATLKLNKKNNAGPSGSGKRGPDAERRAPIRGKGVSRPRQSLEQAKAEREQRQAQFEGRRGDERRSGPPGRPSDRPTDRHSDRPFRGHEGGDRGGPRGDARGPARGPAHEGHGGHGSQARDGWRNQGPRFESRSEQGFRGREQPRFEGRNDDRFEGRFEGRNEGRPQFRDDGRGPQGRPYESRDARGPGGYGPRGSQGPQGSQGSQGQYGQQGPRQDDRRPGFGRDANPGRGYGHGGPDGGPRRHPDDRFAPSGPGGAGRREDRWQGQRPSYSQEPRRESFHDSRREDPREGYRGQRQDSRQEPRQDQRRASGPRPGYPRPSAAAERAGQQLPAHLREAAAQLRRQLNDDEDDEDGDVYIDPNSEGVRLSKQMGVLGLASRREADEWIAAGWVRVDGKLAVLGQRVSPDVKIEIDPLAHKEQAKRVTILLHKPIAYVSGQAEDGYEPASVLIKSDAQWGEDSSGIKYHIGHSRGLAPAGRLDIDSTGLLVLTQDGRIAKLLIGEDSSIEKEYLVRVEYHGRDGVRSEDGRLPAADLALLNHGLELDGVQLKPAKVSWQNEDQLRFVLREGRKRQIRRMCEQVGLKVVGLKRVRIGRINLGNLPVGQWRFLTPWERFD